MAREETGEEQDLGLRTEALLFAAGKPLTVHEIASRLGVEDFRDVQKALKHLHHNYSSRLTALELTRAGEGWTIQVRKPYLLTARSVAPIEIPKHALKTLALTAYHQPVLQSRLVKMIGNSVYEDVPILREMGFLRASEKANSLELTTTGRFAEYFGFGTGDKGKLKELLAKNLGITVKREGKAKETEINLPDSEDPSTPSEPTGPPAGLSRTPPGS